ncbi:MAG: ClbS/DfsB family four-helix bundle protein [Planctomycetota bacterium]
MSTIPRTREDLLQGLSRAFDKLQATLDEAGPRSSGLLCVEDWSLRDLLAVRVWWAESIADWIEAGRTNTTLDLPAPGYAWRETPRLNDDIVRRSKTDSLRSLRSRLEQAVERVRSQVDELSDRQLLEPGAFEWTGRYALARWISMNTTRQFKTARIYVRRAM